MMENEARGLNQYHKTPGDIQKELEQIREAQANPARFDVLYERYYKQIFVFVFRRSGDEETSADIVSQVFLKALININRYQHKGLPFSAWLFRIAMNEINMYFRKNKADRVISLDKGDFRTLIDEESSYDLEKEQRVMQALTQLPEESLQLIELRFFEKRSFSEVGDIFGITENNAKTKVYRVLEKLKTLIIQKT